LCRFNGESNRAGAKPLQRRSLTGGAALQRVSGLGKGLSVLHYHGVRAWQYLKRSTGMGMWDAIECYDVHRSASGVEENSANLAVRPFLARIKFYGTAAGAYATHHDSRGDR
jgi:hypothetical protein